MAYFSFKLLVFNLVTEWGAGDKVGVFISLTFKNACWWQVRILISLFPPSLLKLYKLLISPIAGGKVAALMVGEWFWSHGWSEFRTYDVYFFYWTFVLVSDWFMDLTLTMYATEWLSVFHFWKQGWLQFLVNGSWVRAWLILWICQINLHGQAG